MARAYPGFCSMKQLRVLLLPPGWDASPTQGYAPAVCCRYPFMHLGGERQCAQGKVSCLGKQHNGRDWALNHRPSDLTSNVLTTTPPRPHALYACDIKCILSAFPLPSRVVFVVRHVTDHENKHASTVSHLG